MAVMVLDKRKNPLMPCSEKRARLLLARGRAVVHRVYPFTIRLKDRRREDSVLQPIRVTLDPGSKTTGIAVVREKETVDPNTGEITLVRAVLVLLELVHRGDAIRDALKQRRGFRGNRRSRNLRYRALRFNNRTRTKGWLPPSLQHRVDTTMAWVSRLSRWAPVTALSQELVRFDMQAMENPEISGVEYQQGTLVGYEVREYLLAKWSRECAYCGAQNVPLEIDHIHPRSTGGSDRVSNLTLACHTCNQAKGSLPVKVFLARKPERLKTIFAQAKAPLKDAAVVNATRWALMSTLRATRLSVEAGSGGRTKWNRQRLGVPKTHCLDAACVGRMDALESWRCPVLSIKSTGRGAYQRTRVTQQGFSRGYLMRKKRVHGFQTGDMVKAIVTTGQKVGAYIGRVAVRASGSFNIQTAQGVVQGISHRYCLLIQRGDGYGYAWSTIATTEGGAGEALSLPGMNAGVSRANG